MNHVASLSRWSALVAIAPIVSCTSCTKERGPDHLPAQVASSAPTPPGIGSGTGSGTGTTPTDASARPVAWNGEGPFRLLYTDFHFEVGTQVLRVEESAQLTYLFSRTEMVDVATYCAKAGTPDDRELCATLKRNGDRQFGRLRWRVARFSLTPASMQTLRQRLVAANMGELAARYADQGHDGSTRDYSLTAGNSTFRTSAYSLGRPTEPPNLLAVRTFLEQVLRDHEQDLKTAQELTEPQRAELEKELRR